MSYYFCTLFADEETEAGRLSITRSVGCWSLGVSWGRLTQDLGNEPIWEIGGLTHTAATKPALCPPTPGAGPCAVCADGNCAEGGTLTMKTSTFPLPLIGKEQIPTWGQGGRVFPTPSQHQTSPT